MTLGLGVQVGNPTGGDKGGGTLNAQVAVYDSGVALTCMPMQKEFLAGGGVDLDKWDKLAVAGNGRQHEAARHFAKLLEEGVDPRDPMQFISKMSAMQALPGYADRGGLEAQRAKRRRDGQPHVAGRRDARRRLDDASRKRGDSALKKIRIRQGTDGPTGSGEQVSTLTLLRLVCSNSPHKPLSVDDIRKRVRIIDAIDDVLPENNNGWLQLEDDDHKALVAAVNDFPWASANHTLLTIIDDVLGAETLPKPKLVLEKVEK